MNVITRFDFVDRFGRNITIFCSHLVYFLGNFGTSLWVFFPKFLEDKGIEETPAIALLGFLRLKMFETNLRHQPSNKTENILCDISLRFLVGFSHHAVSHLPYLVGDTKRMTNNSLIQSKGFPI